jgi:hypothetical protein
LLIGELTCQWNACLPPASFSSLASVPLLATISPSGTVICRSKLSGLSLGWSLHGHHRSAPSPWQLVAIHGRLSLVCFHVKPPFHGGLVATCGLPPYWTATANSASFAGGVAGSIQMRPCSCANFAGLPSTATLRAVSSPSRSSAILLQSPTARARIVSVPSIVFSAGSTASARS